MKKIGIAGGGLAGLSAAWALLQYPSVEVTLFDPKGIGGGASGVSTGLLHPYPGKWGRRSWKADEGMEASRALIDLVEEETGKVIADRRGILRLALTEQQKVDFKNCVDPLAQWWPEERVVEQLPDAVSAPGLWMPHGLCVYSELYLQGLWSMCEKRGARLEKRDFYPENFDTHILATGHHLAPLLPTPLSVTRGQSLICRWAKKTPFTLLAQGHLSSTADPSLCQLGSTYEDPTTALDRELGLELKEKIALFYPPAKTFQVLESKVGYRLAREGGYRPFVLKKDEKTWVYGGLGSRGMLYHAWLGKALAEAVIGGFHELRPDSIFKCLSL